jgi:hypothetical protein
MSEVKVNKISPRSGTTVTLGDSGDTFTIPSGATITNSGTANGFGADGAVNWQTSIKTSTFTAVNQEGYFCDTSGGAFTVNLPSGSAGNIVAFKDYKGIFQTNNLTIAPNGTDKIDGVNASAIISTENAALVLVFADSTRGWLNVNDSTSVEGAVFVSATGGTILTSGDFKTHVFTGPGTFCVSAAAGPLAVVDYLVVGAGGGGGGSEGAGGAGAGGFRASGGTASGCYTVSPLSSSPSPVAGLPVAIQGYPIVVGAGGTAGTSPPASCTTGGNGAVSTFSTITSAGGGGGGAGDNCNSQPAGSGGSGGGSGSNSPSSSFGAGNTPPVSPSQGNPGGQGLGNPTPNANGSGAGGGAGAVGGDGKSPGGGDGGVGSYSAITTSTCYGTPGPVGSVRYFAGGGGSGLYGPGPIGAGGAGGGGDGGRNSPSSGVENGDTNTGGGGGGNGPNPNTSPTEKGGTGGSGIVMIRYKFQ